MKRILCHVSKRPIEDKHLLASDIVPFKALIDFLSDA